MLAQLLQAAPHVYPGAPPQGYPGAPPPGYPGAPGGQPGVEQGYPAPQPMYDRAPQYPAQPGMYR